MSANESRPVGSKAAIESHQTTHSLWCPDTWHQQAEWENEVHYSLGFDAGLEYARRIVDAGIEEACAGVMPTAKAVVDRLVRGMP